MPREKQQEWWRHVTEIANTKKWKCNYCNAMRSGGVGTIKIHLPKCSKYCPTPEEVHNAIAHDAGCNDEIRRLNQVVEELERAEQAIAMLKARGKKCKPNVDVWLEELRDLKQTATSLNISDDTYDVTDMIEQLKHHQKNSPLILSTEFIGHNVETYIQEILRLLDETVFIIGIHGMGGVGKTLLATLVEDVVKRKGSFKDVFWVTVSSNFSISNLQSDIAKRIGLELDGEDEKLRAEQLSSALEKKEAVIILDDVWKYIDLDKVGVHPRVKGLKVIITTRLKHLCQQMSCLPDHIITVIPLSFSCKVKSEDEDWELFILELGHGATPKTLPLEIKKIARCIVKRCEGLPLGICVMARAMKGIDDIHQWRHTYNKQNNLEMGQEMVEEVYKALKRSYDNLLESNLQDCFLYCALMSSTYESDKGELIMKLVDSRVINGTRCLNEIFDEGNTLLNKLAGHSLMSSHGYSVFTHRLLIDIASFIWKENQKTVLVKIGKEFTKIDFTQEWAADLNLVHLLDCDIKEIPEDMSPNCNKLSTLIMNHLQFSDVPESFFKYMNTLLVLDLSYNKDLVSLPNSLSNLNSLSSLILRDCVSLKLLPPLGDLHALSRLVISGSSIEEAPKGLEKLINLKWLDLSNNRNLNLELGLIFSNLTKLQYLNLLGISAVVTIEDVQGLKMLECFGGAFDCNNYHAQNMVDMIYGLKTYYLHFRNAPSHGKFSINCTDINNIIPGHSCNKTVWFGDCNQFHTLPEELTCLKIDENNNLVCLCDALSCNRSSSLSRIGLHNCLKLENLFCLSGSCSFCTNILNLEVLKIENLASLVDVCKDNSVGRQQSLSHKGIFSFLTEFYITECHLIKRLLTPQLVQQLQNLEKLMVINCELMIQIFEENNTDDSDGTNIALPKLTSLTLSRLPQLNTVCRGSILCGSLPTVSISECPKLQRRPTIGKWIPEM